MELQLHDSGLEAFNFRRASRFIPNPYYQAGRFAMRTRPGRFAVERGRRIFGRLLHEAQGTPTYTQFLSEEGLSGNESFDLQASRFGRWIKTKAVPGLQKVQKSLSPIIGLLPGGGAVNAAFDIIKRPEGAPGPAVEPVFQPLPPAAPSFGPPPSFAPQFMPEPMPPTYAGFAPQPAPGGFNFFGLDTKTLLLLGIGGIVAYKAFKK
jgi:hypothetical protein